jgi:hypothetical protein
LHPTGRHRGLDKSTGGYSCWFPGLVVRQLSNCEKPKPTKRKCENARKNSQKNVSRGKKMFGTSAIQSAPPPYSHLASRNCPGLLHRNRFPKEEARPAVRLRKKGVCRKGPGHTKRG